VTQLHNNSIVTSTRSRRQTEALIDNIICSTIKTRYYDNCSRQTECQ